MQIASLELYDLLKAKLGEKEAKTLVTFIEEELESKLEKKTDSLATKEYVKAELANTKAEIIKWMFIFWIGQIGALLGILMVFLKK